MKVDNIFRGEKDGTSRKVATDGAMTKKGRSGVTDLVANNQEKEETHFQWSMGRDWAFFYSTLAGNRINQATVTSEGRRPSRFVSILFNELSDAIDNENHQDIYEVYLRVQREMLKKEVSGDDEEEGRNQVCEFQSSLRKKLVLTKY